MFVFCGILSGRFITETADKFKWAFINNFALFFLIYREVESEILLIIFN